MTDYGDYTPMEVRYVSDVPEVRSIGDTSDGHITGHAASFGKLSRRLGGFHERVSNETFNESRAAGWPNVVCRYNHKPEFVLGTTASGTLKLDIDERGLPYDVLPPKTRADILELVQRGDVRYSSFAFRANPENGDEWTTDTNGYPLRVLHNVELIDVAPVLDPAYFDTTASARNMTGAAESLARWFSADPTEARSMLEEGNIAKFFKRTDIPSLGKKDAEERESEATVSADNSTADKESSVETESTNPEVQETEEERAKLSTKARNALSDSDFAYIDEKGERHFPIHDKEHVQKALQLGPRSPMWSKAKAKVLAAAKKFGVTAEEQNSILLEALEERIALVESVMARIEERSNEDAETEERSADEGTEERSADEGTEESAEESEESRQMGNDIALKLAEVQMRLRETEFLLSE